MSDAVEKSIVEKLYSNRVKYLDLWSHKTDNEFAAVIGGKKFQIERRLDENDGSIEYVVWLVDDRGAIVDGIFSNSFSDNEVFNNTRPLMYSAAIQIVFEQIKDEFATAKLTSFLNALDD